MTTATEVISRLLASSDLDFIDSKHKESLELDRTYLAVSDYPTAQFVWVVENSGTRICRIGLDTEEVLGHLECLKPLHAHGDHRSRIYLVRDGSGRAISVEEAIKRLRQPQDFRIDGSRVLCNQSGRDVFRFRAVQVRSSSRAPSVEVHFTNIGQGEAALHALCSASALAQVIGRAEVSSAFGGVDAVTIDGIAVHLAIALRRSSFTPRSGRGPGRLAPRR